MILPGRHVKLSNSMLGVGASLLQRMDDTQTVTMLWNAHRDGHKAASFEKFTLGLDFLFILGVIEYRDGIIRRTS